jgi:N-acylglucosamine-6-phosphate 2-epimerase
MDLFEQIHGGLIVSCQPDAYDRAGDPMNSPFIMAALARSAEMAGAVGIRADGEDDIAAVCTAVRLPVIGLFKADLPGFDVRITPTLAHARRIAASGAHAIAVDATRRPRPEGPSTAEFIHLVKEATGLPVFADVSIVEEGLEAAQAGADALLTTLSGYTAYSPQREEPDFGLIEALAARAGVPVIAEGRINTPEQAAQALACGAWAVTVGSAITRPRWITRRFVEGLRPR